MYKTKDIARLNRGTKFVISCGYFNKANERTHTTDLIVDLIQDKPASSCDNQTKMTSAA